MLILFYISNIFVEIHMKLLQNSRIIFFNEDIIAYILSTCFPFNTQQKHGILQHSAESGYVSMVTEAGELCAEHFHACSLPGEPIQ